MRGFPRSLAGAFALVLAILLGWLLTEISRQPEEGTDFSKRAIATVDGVVDGDTARVWLDGERESVRYIGIDTPEMNYGEGQPSCFASRATARNQEMLDRNEQVTLVFDRERRDRYGRLLAFVYSGRTLLQAELLKGGYATTIEVPPNTSRAVEFADLEDQARRVGRGLWSAC